MREHQTIRNDRPAINGSIRTLVCGSSMKPFFRAGQMVAVKHVAPETIKKGNVILYAVNGSDAHIMHRVQRVVFKDGKRWFLCRGDNCSRPDGYIGEHQLIGRLIGRYDEKGVKPFRRTHEYADLILAGWYRRVKPVVKKIIVAVRPWLPQSAVRKVIVRDCRGNEREIFFMGWGRLQFSRDLTRLAARAQQPGVE